MDLEREEYRLSKKLCHSIFDGSSIGYAFDFQGTLHNQIYLFALVATL